MRSGTNWHEQHEQHTQKEEDSNNIGALTLSAGVLVWEIPVDIEEVVGIRQKPPLLKGRRRGGKH